MKQTNGNKPKKLSLLQQAELTINGARQQEYGDKLANFSQISMLWTALLARKLTSPITPEDVALLMINVKAARLAHKPDHKDSWLDIAGYSGCADKLQEERDNDTELPGIIIDFGTKD